MIRAWRAPIVTGLRVGFERAPGEPPCEPAAWVPVDIDGDVEDAVLADDGRSMWRTTVDANDVRWPGAYLCVRGEARRLSDFAWRWEDETDAENLLRSAMESVPVGRGRSLVLATPRLALLAAIELTRAVAHLNVKGCPSRASFTVAEACVRDPSVENYEGLLVFRRQAASSVPAQATDQFLRAQSAFWLRITPTFGPLGQRFPAGTLVQITGPRVAAQGSLGLYPARVKDGIAWISGYAAFDASEVASLTSITSGDAERAAWFMLETTQLFAVQQNLGGVREQLPRSILRIAQSATLAARGDPAVDLAAVVRGVMPTQWVFSELARLAR